MSRATDQIELGLGIVLGAGAIYLGYKAVRALSAGGSSLQEQIDRATKAADVAAGSSLQAGANEWENPECADPNDPLCVKRQPGPHQVVDEQGNPVGTIDWSKVGHNG